MAIRTLQNPTDGSRIQLPIYGSTVLTLVVAASSHLGLFGAALALGVVIGVFGHIIHSRALIITGILVIGLVSAYFSFVLQPSGR
jgi:hypothetical protein